MWKIKSATMKGKATFVWWLQFCIAIGKNVTFADLTPSETFDFIVVGAGSAGSVLANRLSADGGYKVALLEKGGEPNPLTEIPGLLPLMYFTENVDKYVTEKQENFGLGLKDQRIPWTKGKGLGGGSLVNYMSYTHGHREDFDRIAAAGNPGWSYEDILPFYKKLECAHLPNVNTTNRGTEGEVDVGHPSAPSEAARVFVEACKETGLPFMDDYLNGEAHGISYLQVNARNGRRCHAEKAFLHDIRPRKNLKIITEALVTKIVIEPVTKTALGVLYQKYGTSSYIHARKEVVISTGTHSSPQLLMLSGIGPRDHLKDMGIEVVKDLPVGKTIYDHVGFPGVFFRLNQSIVPTYGDVLNAETVSSFWKDGQGPLTVPAGNEVIGFIQTPVSGEGTNYADVEIILTGGALNFDHGLFIRNEWAITDETYEAIWGSLTGQTLCTVLIVPFRPLSKGHMELRSTRPGEQPKFYGNYFTDPEGKDMKTIIAAIRMVEGIVASPALAKYGAEVVLTPAPGCEDHQADSDGFWECQVRHVGSSLWHQVASCRMGPESDPDAVVDNELRVHGVKNLRVADVSVLPKPISAHTMVPAMMIGEKAANMILSSCSE